MRDYIFNSKKQAKQRAQRRRLRMTGLLIVVGAIAIGVNYFTRTHEPVVVNTTGGSADDRGDALVLPSQNPSKLQTSEPKQTQIPDSPQAPKTAATEKAPEAAEIIEPTAVTESADSSNWIDHPVKPGESLSAIFKQYDLTPALLHRIVNSSEAASNLAKIRPGQTVHFGMSQDQQLQQLILERDRISSLHIALSDTGISSEEQSRALEKKTRATTRVINSSLFVDGQAAGLSDKLIMQLAKVFGWDIDFALDVMPGDSFSLLYEEQYLDGGKFSDGPILAAEFINQGKTFRAVQYTDQEGNTSYYDDSGHIKQRAFLRTPVKFARISSRFTRKRWHPVLKKWRSHKGVDYAAPTGTPVKAAGTGKIVFKGKKGGYGNVIFLRHGGRYTTVYGHLSKFARNLKNGNKIKQGQIIGYVGSTGLATGPHLHYEFRVNGVHRNPLTVKLPKSIALPKSQMADFKSQTAALLAQLEKERTSSMVALAE
jgi:murein DD-endopeptidase MepM/ murein hydrolase activator NlpD